MEKVYSPKEVENHLYEKWLKSDCFKGKPDSEKTSYSIAIPPPNVTGVLTIGHVLNNTIQDILVRRARQNGHSVLWLPGTDHAGIVATFQIQSHAGRQGSLLHGPERALSHLSPADEVEARDGSHRRGV